MHGGVSAENIINQRIGIMMMMYLFLYKKYGYRVVFSKDGIVLRKQFFSPGVFTSDISDFFWIPKVIESEYYIENFVANSLSDPFKIIDYSNEIFDRVRYKDGSAVFKNKNNYYSVYFRNVVIKVPVKILSPVCSITSLIVPERYRFKPNFETVFK